MARTSSVFQPGKKQKPALTEESGDAEEKVHGGVLRVVDADMVRVVHNFCECQLNQHAKPCCCDDKRALAVHPPKPAWRVRGLTPVERGTRGSKTELKTIPIHCCCVDTNQSAKLFSTNRSSIQNNDSYDLLFTMHDTIVVRKRFGTGLCGATTKFVRKCTHLKAGAPARD